MPATWQLTMTKAIRSHSTTPITIQVIIFPLLCQQLLVAAATAAAVAAALQTGVAAALAADLAADAVH